MNIFKKLGSDIKGFNRKNNDEDTVLNANYFSMYRKKFVIKKAGFKDRSFSFGILFISPNLRAGSDAGRDIVRHEYGHTIQLKKLGLGAYFKYIGKPSMASTVAGNRYYEQPWEVFADVEGGVTSRKHDETTIQAGYDYLSNSSRKKKKRKS